ncbi:MAG: hydrolase [Rickettsiales bacterium]|nr:hydrolase [Rickettsiales bacterium]
MDKVELLTWIDSQHDRMVETVLAWSRINSGSFNVEGVRAMREVLAEAFSPLGGEAEILPIAPLQTVNASGEVDEIPLAEALRIRKRPDAPMKIVLSGHMDTVFPKDCDFQEPVWLDDNTINGPGVTDLKGGLVCMLVALEALEQSEFADQIGWEILLNPDEEIGSQGSSPYLVEAAQRNDVGMIYEPSLADGTLAGARKGSGNFVFVVKGKAAHAGREFDKGRNAIALLAEIITALYEINGRRDDVTLNPGKIEGGGPTNVVPDTAILRFNVRMPEPEDQVWLQSEFDKIVEKFSSREGFSVGLHGAFTRPPKPLSEENTRLFELVRDCGVELGQQIRWKATGGCCDGNNMAAAGLPNVDTLGVRGGAIHSDEEFLLVGSLTERAKLSLLVLMKLAEVGWKQ